MAATLTQIRGWFDRGRKENHAYLVVLCDTYDWEDYPSYHDSQEEAQKAIDAPSSMQKVMEVYDLAADRDSQLSQHRCWALKPVRA